MLAYLLTMEISHGSKKMAPGKAGGFIMDLHIKNYHTNNISFFLAKF